MWFGRAVQQQNFRVTQQAPGKQNPLTYAAGKAAQGHIAQPAPVTFSQFEYIRAVHRQSAGGAGHIFAPQPDSDAPKGNHQRKKHTAIYQRVLFQQIPDGGEG